MSRAPRQVSRLLHSLQSDLPKILGRNLVGIYLYGSLTQNSFNPKRSDIDCIVVTHRDLSDVQFAALSSSLKETKRVNPWSKRLQISFLIRNQILKMNAKACLYQFGVLQRCGSDGNPIIWMNVLKSGIVLFGPRPETFVPPITRSIVLAALEREVGYLRDEFTNRQSKWRNVAFYRVYAVLTLCRILFSFHNNDIVSKQVAAKWVLKSFPNQWNEVVNLALRAKDKKSDPRIPLVGIRRFISFVEAVLRNDGKGEA